MWRIERCSVVSEDCHSKSCDENPREVIGGREVIDVRENCRNSELCENERYGNT